MPEALTNPSFSTNPSWQAAAADTIMIETNKQTIHDYAAAFSAGDLERVRALHTNDAVVRGVLGWGSVDDVMPIWADLVKCLAIKLEVEGIIAEGNLIAARFKETGEARAPFRGLPATGKSYELVAMEWYEMKGGLIHRRWGARDAAGQARQLGWSD
jgi:steroid delta-isomerase-like uncharacterized protein